MHRLTFCVIGLICSMTAFGQGEANSLKGVPVKERIITGGGFGLSFSSYSDFFSLSPQIGYMATRRLMLGTGITYRYTKYKDYSPVSNVQRLGCKSFCAFYCISKYFYSDRIRIFEL